MDSKRQIKGHPLRVARRERAAERAADAVTDPQDQLDILDARLGEGKGAARERAALEARL